MEMDGSKANHSRVGRAFDSRNINGVTRGRILNTPFAPDRLVDRVASQSAQHISQVCGSVKRITWRNRMTADDFKALLVPNIGYLLLGMFKMDKDATERIRTALDNFQSGTTNMTLMAQTAEMDPARAAAAAIAALEGTREAQLLIDQALELGGAPGEAREALKSAMLSQIRIIENRYPLMESMLTKGPPALD